MAMNKKPKPLRPDPTKANYKGNTGKNPVVKVTKVTRPLKKATVRNPSAPSAAAPRGGGVRVMTRSESALKKGNVQSNKSDGKRTPPPGRNRNMTQNEKYKKSTGNQRLIESTQQITKKGYIGLTAADKKAINPKGGKTSGVTPKKNTPPAPKPRGRFGRGMGGGGFFGSGAIRKSK